MKKYNNLFLMGLLSSVISSFAALEDTKPSFVESTKNGLEIASILYAAGYGFAHGIGTSVLAPMHATMEADFERWKAKENGEKISFKKTANTFSKEFKDAFCYVNKGILKSHRIAAPVVLAGIIGHNLHKKSNP